MKIEISETNDFILKEVFKEVQLQTETETFNICMRDSGFEFYYEGNWYLATKGKIEKISPETSTINREEFVKHQINKFAEKVKQLHPGLEVNVKFEDDVFSITYDNNALKKDKIFNGQVGKLIREELWKYEIYNFYADGEEGENEKS
jgi:hypothetical protein